MHKPNEALALCLAVTLASCAAQTPAQEPAAAASAGQEKSGNDRNLRAHMSDNFKTALEAREALIDGNLAVAREKARQLAGESYEGELPDNWMPGVAVMQTAARDVAGAPSLEEASRAMARLASSCGECHSRFEAGDSDPEVHHGFSAKGPEDMATRMARHQRAADGFWFGLTIPSDAEWRGGARALTEAPDGPAQLEGKPVDSKLDQSMEAIRAMGRRALTLETTEERVELYGELLASCSGCHES